MGKIVGVGTKSSSSSSLGRFIFPSFDVHTSQLASYDGFVTERAADHRQKGCKKWHAINGMISFVR